MLLLLAWEFWLSILSSVLLQIVYMCKRISINVCSETPFSKNPHHIKPTHTQPTPILLCDCLKELIQLFEENFSCPDDQVLDLNKQTQRTWKTVAASKSFLWVSLIQITYRYVNIFHLILRSFLFLQDFSGSGTRREDLQMFLLKKWSKMPTVRTIFSNDDRACCSTQLKTVSRHGHFNWPSPQISEQLF